MDAVGLLKQKGIKKLEAREKIAAAITDGSFSLGELQSRIGELKEKQIATVLEAIEEVTGRRSARLSVWSICVLPRTIFFPRIIPAIERHLA